LDILSPLPCLSIHTYEINAVSTNTKIGIAQTFHTSADFAPAMHTCAFIAESTYTFAACVVTDATQADARIAVAMHTGSVVAFAKHTYVGNVVGVAIGLNIAFPVNPLSQWPLRLWSNISYPTPSSSPSTCGISVLLFLPKNRIYELCI
jgi:hypothetical protein